MLEQLYQLLILIGVTIGLVLAYLWREARSASNLSLALIRLNEHHQFDAPLVLRNAWPLLAKSGLNGMRWQLTWFGMVSEGQIGVLTEPLIKKNIEVGEMKLAIFFQQGRITERRYFDEALIETFMLLLRTDMWIKAGTIDASFAHMAKLSLFLQHDMKNLAQFIQLMADQVATVPTEKEHLLLEYLRMAAPMVLHRADRIVNRLTLESVGEVHRRAIQIQDEVEQICKLYRLDHVIHGAATALVPDNTLDSALDNVLKNYSDIAGRQDKLKPLITIDIRDHVQTVEVTIAAAGTVMVTNIERLFEPFWSSDPAGLGIGLYQAKQMLFLCNSTINVVQVPAGHLEFHIVICKDDASRSC
ncbi:sensor histidine kinase [Undibacterium sp. RuTC16W]|uniref:sensor histidine kinase n=1 Tax=Undibacterium sp. RuTC16W TaxID=3413048 RepID=UPI003BEF7C31